MDSTLIQVSGRNDRAPTIVKIFLKINSEAVRTLLCRYLLVIELEIAK